MTRRKHHQPRVEGDVAYIPLTRGFEAIIDVADLPEVAQHSWHVRMGSEGHAYARRSWWNETEPHTPRLMHRFLLKVPLGTVVDHINGNGLDNRRANLRVCNLSQNNINRVRQRLDGLGRGVNARKNGKYYAYISRGNKTIHLGSYETPEEAAAAYRGAAKALYGEFVPDSEL
jgi:hypothetical protein